MLKKYLDDRGMKIYFFCEKIGVSKVTIYNIFKGIPVSKEIAQIIFDYTKGEVSVPFHDRGTRNRSRKKKKEE